MKTNFDVDETDVARMDAIGFVNFVNHLLRAEGSRVGIPPVNIHTSLRVNTPDGGVDACVEGNVQQSDWIPLGTSAWQFKSGKDHEQAKIRKEFQKPGVQEVLKEGGSYCIVVCDDLGNTQLGDREKVLKDCCRDAGFSTDRARLYAADKIAAWARQHPAMRLLLGGPIIGNLFRWETWNALSQFGQPFAADPQRQEILDAIRHGIEDPSGPLTFRLAGRAGVGKSRLVLEALRPQNSGSGLAERALYADNPLAIPDGLFHWLELNSDTSLILVVDECDRTDEERLERQAQRCNGRLRLIIIAETQSAISSQPADSYHLGILNDAAMRNLLVAVVKDLPSPAYAFAIRVASGYVKIAVKLVEAMRRHPERISLQEMLSFDPDVRSVIHDFLVTDEGDLRVMRAIALMSRVGWDSELQEEGKAVVALVGFDWHEARSRVKRLTDEGIVAKQGRYRYVTPHLLAVWLASEVWDIYGDEPLRVLNNLPSANGRRAFLERLRDIGDDPHAKRVCETLLGPHGQFYNLEALNDTWQSQVFAILSEAHPQVGVRALQRLLSGLSCDELTGLKGGRRQIVWLLQQLAWLPDLFEDVARILLALAEAENETWGNNASEAWVGLFGTYLGNTAVSALNRHFLIAEALDSTSTERKLLAVRALNRVFTVRESTSTFGGAKGGRITPERWSPETGDEDRAVRWSGLRLLDRALASEILSVREAAEGVLLKQVCEIALAGLADELLERIRTLPIPDYDRRRKVREAAQRVLTFERLPLTSDQRDQWEQFCEKLAGESYHERLRRWVGQRIFADVRREQKLGPDAWGQEAASLADEAVQHPELLQGEMEWLTSDQAQHIYSFARRLGELDAEHHWWPNIEALACDGRVSTFAAAYLLGNVNAGRQDWREFVLDSWIQEGPHLAHVILDAVFRSTPPSNRDAERLFNLMEKGWLSASQVSVLAWSGQSSPLTLEGLQRIITGVLKEEGERATDTALGLIYNRLSLVDDDEAALEALAWQALERPRSLAQDAFYGEELIKRYAPRNLVRAVGLALRQVEEADSLTTPSDSTMSLLQQATRLDPKGVWEEVAPRLFPLCQETYSLYLALQGWYGNLIGPDIFLRWADANKPDGPWLAASLTQVSGQPMNDLARELLMRYQEDSSVGEALSARFASGSWTGPTSGWYQTHIDAARGWMNDPHPAVRVWAASEVQNYEQRLAEALLLEEEAYRS